MVDQRRTWGIEYERFSKEIYEYKRVDNDCLICYSLLNRFYEGNRVEITFRFQDEIADLLEELHQKQHEVSA